MRSAPEDRPTVDPLWGQQTIAASVIIDVVNAAERFLHASRAHDVGAAASELAADVVMLNPATDEPVVGQQAVAGALRAVEAACDEFRHTHLLSDQGAGDTSLFALVFEAKVGDQTMRRVDLLELDDHDRIHSLTVMARPMPALMVLGAPHGRPASVDDR